MERAFSSGFCLSGRGDVCISKACYSDFVLLIRSFSFMAAVFFAIVLPAIVFAARNINIYICCAFDWVAMVQQCLITLNVSVENFDFAH